MFRVPSKNEDVKNLRTGLTAFEIHEARNECAKLKEIEAQKAALGTRWLLHKSNAPERGTYNRHGVRLA